MLRCRMEIAIPDVATDWTTLIGAPKAWRRRDDDAQLFGCGHIERLELRASAQEELEIRQLAEERAGKGGALALGGDEVKRLESLD